jgi:uncharacterized protein YegP (UPF0339 family)
MLSKVKAFLKRIAPPWGGPGWDEGFPAAYGKDRNYLGDSIPETGYDADGNERILTDEEIKEQDHEFYELIDPKGCHIELYKDKKKEWRWRFFSANNKILACSGEGYKRKASMRKSLNIVREVIPFVPVEEE